MKTTSAEVSIRDLDARETDHAADVLAQGMRDNPLHIQALGERPDTRERALAGVFRSFLHMEATKKGRVLGAFRQDALVGVWGMMKPGCCQLAPGEKLSLLPKLVCHCGLKGTGRLLAQFGNWSKHDPHEPHWHLGPVGILRELQGQGIGSLLMKEFCSIVDADRLPSWLETDKEVNVTFYRKHGFEVVAEDEVNGARNWFMKRAARR